MTTEARPSTSAPSANGAAPSLDALASAKEAGLTYVADGAPGIRRLKNGRGFRYLSPAGRSLRDPTTLGRIRSLAVPPAWTEVWICPATDGHVQATGRDAKGRKQYRYHPDWSEVRNGSKFTHTLVFAELLPRIRERIDRDLALPGLPREKVLAAVLQLLQDTLIRVGNEEYARKNRAYGLTTLKDKHVLISASRLRFRFRGKAGKEHVVDLEDRRLARVVRRCREIRGAELFQYVDDEGQGRAIDSGDVNAYLREITGHEFSAKDFRTWGGTLLAMRALHELGACGSRSEAKKNVVECIRQVARQLGNTPAVCRRYYVHPVILEGYVEGSLLDRLARARKIRRKGARGLTRDEVQLIALLRAAERASRQDVGQRLKASLRRLPRGRAAGRGVARQVRAR